jgi:endonuclease YncB( thermonuclease family)
MIRTSLCALWFLTASLAIPAELRGVVVGIADGDTITVLDGGRKQHKIRLAGIDAPERKQPFGQRSREHLANLAFRKAANLDCYKTDQYKRQICRVWVEGADVALAQVRAGLAWHYKRFEKEQTEIERTTYATAEDGARASRIGLWQDKQPVPPWEYRSKR